LRSHHPHGRKGIAQPAAGAAGHCCRACKNVGGFARRVHFLGCFRGWRLRFGVAAGVAWAFGVLFRQRRWRGVAGAHLGHPSALETSTTGCAHILFSFSSLRFLHCPHSISILRVEFKGFSQRYETLVQTGLRCETDCLVVLLSIALPLELTRRGWIWIIRCYCWLFAKMSRTSVFTSITPLPTGITRQSVLDTYHNHTEMIELNPLVVERFRCKPPNYAPAEEFHSIWYTIKGTSTSHIHRSLHLHADILIARVDKVSYLPGGLANGSVSYHACFHDLPEGLQTHVYAPLGLDIRAKWSVGGSLPGEPKEAMELGIGAPREGLYIREDVRMKCNIMMMGFVKKTFKESHAKLVDRLVEKAHILESEAANARLKMLKEVAPRERMGHGSIFIAPPPGYTPMESPPQQGADGGYFLGASQQQHQARYQDQDPQRQDSVLQSQQNQQLQQPQLPIYQEFHRQRLSGGNSSSSHTSPHLQALHHQSLSSNTSSNSNQSPLTSPNLSQASTVISQSNLMSPPPLFSEKPLPSPPSQFQQARYQHKHTHSENIDHGGSFRFRVQAGDTQDSVPGVAETRPRSSTIATARPVDEQQGLAILPATTYLPSTTYKPATLPATTYLPASTYTPRERSRSGESGAYQNLAPPPAELPGTQVYSDDSPVLGRHMKFAAELPG